VNEPTTAHVESATDDGDDGPLCSGFVATRTLADLLYHKRIRRVAARIFVCGGRRYELIAAMMIVDCLHGDSDPYGLLGGAEPTAELERAGALFEANLMQLGDAVYRVVAGVLAVACVSS
jgi:hypothetical protein